VRAAAVSEAALQDALVMLEQVRRDVHDSRAREQELAAKAASQAEGHARAVMAIHDEHQRQLIAGLAGVREVATAAAARRGRELALGVASLDDGRTLSDVLERLAAASRQVASRSVLFVIRNDRLYAWRSDADSGADHRGAMSWPLDDAGAIGSAARTGSVATGSAGAAAWPWQRADGGDHLDGEVLSVTEAVVAAPVVVDGAVVAVVCAAEQPEGAQPGESAGFTEPESLAPELDILARHAGRLLESMTVQRATGLWRETPSASLPAAVARGSRVEEVR
jgi:hypothetical protein